MQGIFRKENTDKALKYGIYRHLPTYEKIIRNLVSFYIKNYTNGDKQTSYKFIVENTFVSIVAGNGVEEEVIKQIIKEAKNSLLGN